MIIIDWINKIKYQMLAKIQLWYQNWGGLVLYISAYTCGRVPSRALSHKSTYTLNLFPVFHYLALMFKSETPQCCYYISKFPNIWYLIKLIHSIIIILRVNICFINSASWQTFEVEKTARIVPVASEEVHVTALCIWNERQTVCLCRPRCLFDLKSLLRRAVYKTLIRARWL